MGIAPKMLVLTELKLKLEMYLGQSRHQVRGFPKLTSLDIETSAESLRDFVFWLGLEQLQNLTVVGYRTTLVKNILIDSIAALQSLANLTIAFRRSSVNIFDCLLSELICQSLIGHHTLECINIYCGAGGPDWTLQSKFQDLHELPYSKFTFSDTVDERSSLDKLFDEGNVVHIQGRARYGVWSTGPGWVVDFECRYKK